MTSNQKQLSTDEIALAKMLRDNPLAFCKIACNGFQPHKGQLEVMRADLHKQESLIVAGRRFGKTYGLVRKVAWDLFRHPGMKLFIYNPSETQSDILFDQVCSLYRTSDYLFKYCKFKQKGRKFTVHEEPLESTLQVIRIGNKASYGRGHGTDGLGYLIADEANAHVHDIQQIADSLEGFIAAGGGLVYLSSASEADERNFFYATYKYYNEMQEAGSKRYRVYQFKIDDIEHIDREIIESQRKKYEKQNRLWVYEREYLGIFNKSQGAYFEQSDIEACSNAEISTGGRLDKYIWSMDPGGRDCPCVLMIGRLNQLEKRKIEIVETRSFIFPDKKQKDDGHEAFGEFEEIVNVCVSLRQKYSCTAFYVDPNTEYSLTQRLQNQFKFPIIPCLIGGYNAKITFLNDLERALADQTIVWNDKRITEQFLHFAPPKNPTTNKYIFDGQAYDLIVCAGMLVRYLGEQQSNPYLVVAGGARAIW